MPSERLNTFLSRIRALIKSRQLDRDLKDEIDFHLSMREQKNREAGMDAQEARYAARRHFGNITTLKEAARQLWTFVSLCGCFKGIPLSPSLPCLPSPWGSAQTPPSSQLRTTFFCVRFRFRMPHAWSWSGKTPPPTAFLGTHLPREILRRGKRTMECLAVWLPWTASDSISVAKARRFNCSARKSPPICSRCSAFSRNWAATFCPKRTSPEPFTRSYYPTLCGWPTSAAVRKSSVSKSG